MMPALIILGLIFVLPLLYVIVQYNSLVSLQNYIRNAWSNIDTELKRRVANNGSPSSQAVDENQLVQALRQLLVVVENYPALKADQHFLELQRELINTENRIQAARRFYNGNVRDYQNKRETFPSSLIAGAFGFQPVEFFSVDPAVREVPSADFAA
jgi:LemA protein